MTKITRPREENIKYWSEMIMKCKESGMPVKQFCLAYGLPLSRYYYWKKEIEKAKALSNDSKELSAKSKYRQFSCVRPYLWGLSYLSGRKIADNIRQKHKDFPASLHCHMFRHSLGMGMFKSGIPLPYIKDYLGHAQSIPYRSTLIRIQRC